MFSELFPIIATTDMSRALGFYRDDLGGKVTYEYPGPDGGLVYAGLEVGSSHLGIARDPGAEGAPARPISLWVYTDDCDAAVERLRAEGVTIVAEPADQPWGERTATVLDPDGNKVIIGQRAGGKPAVDSVGASLISPEPTKYTRIEYERRFLVSPTAGWRDFVEPYFKKFVDIYIRNTRLRLRILMDSDTGLEFIKMTKKVESASPYFQTIGSIPLSPYEHDLLASLEGDRLTKLRYYHFYRGHVFSIDVFEGELEGLVLCEVETGGVEELMRIEVPDYAAVEVTEDAFFTGGNLCRTSREELKRKLEGMGISLG